MNENTINICACASDNYTMQCGVLFCSICENNKKENIHFFVIVDDKFSKEHKQQIQNLISQYNNKQVEFLLVPDEKIDNFLSFENYFYTRHVFYRWLIPILLPSEIIRVLYLDCDIIVRHSLRKLWKTDLTDIACGVVHDAEEAKISQFNRLGYSYEKGYFNSGMMLINLAYWRRNNIMERLFSFLKDNFDKIEMPDQDPLNVVLQDNKKFVPFTYNLQSGQLLTINNMIFDYYKYRDELNVCREDPVVLHLSGARPWIKGCKHPYKNEFFKYRDKTIWKDEPLWDDYAPLKERLFMSNKVRKILSRFGLCHVLEDPYDRTLRLKD